uniref:Pentatricopeptide repeat-containing protein At5g02830, chloroplastic n=2 Tax=Anthurium amnicola TaxID=1678845 RepID=A0A1D1Z7S7_9ARAE
MRELEVLLCSSLAFPPPTTASLLPNLRRQHHQQRRRRRPSPPPPWPPSPAACSPLLTDIRRGLVIPPTSTAPAPAPAGADRRLLRYYAALASKLAGGGRLHDFLAIAEGVMASGAVAAGPSQFVARIDTKLVSRGISAILRRGELGEVLEFLGRVDSLGIRPSALFDNAAAEALAVQCRGVLRSGRVEEFVQVMETLAGYQFYIKHIVDPIHVLKIFVENGDPNMAVRYASVLPHAQFLFCSIIQEFGKKKDLGSALSAFEAVKQKSGGFNMFACRSIIDVCGLCGDFLRSRALFKELLLTDKITPNTHVFNSIMNVNAHDLSYTFYVYRKMQSLGVTLDVASFNILLKSCCLAKRVDLAQDIYQEIKHMASRKTLELDVITYSTMIKAFADAKMWQMALKIKEDMLLAAVRPNIITWSSLISACANAGLVDQAVQIFEEMLLVGCEPNSQCCNILLHACVESCQYDRAFRFFLSWKENGFRIYSTVENSDSVNTQGSLWSATDNEPTRISLTHDYAVWYAKIVPFRPTTATYNILMKACGTDYHHARNLMNDMQVIGLSPNHISWSVLINICGSSCNMSGALQAFKTMRDVGIKPDVIAYTTAIKACVENKNLKIAYSLLEEMKRYKLRPNLVTYNTLLRARTRYGSLHEVRQCLAIYQDMRRAGYSANDYFLKELLEEWCEGVLCSSTDSRGLLGFNDYFRGTDKAKSQSLIEKIAILLHKDTSENQVVDLRGLSKVEARIVVLSVLRMIKESYRLGHAINDDMIVITGIGKETSGEANHEREVQCAMIKVLKGELCLDVLVGQGGIPVTNVADVDLPRTKVRPSLTLQKTELLESMACVRRPQDAGMLRVTRTSLYRWLQKSR